MTKFDKPFPTLKYDEKKALFVKMLVKSAVWAFAIFGMLFVLLIFMILGALKSDIKGVGQKMPKNMILTINFDEPMSEKRADDLLVEFMETPAASFYDVIAAINLAAEDKKVKAIVADVGSADLGMAQVQELREAIKKFRQGGKKAYIYSNGMGNFGGGTAEYYLASAFSQIWMQPNSEIGITGFGIEVPFAKDALGKIGVYPEFYSRYEYKSAAASLTDSTMSKEFKSEINKLGKSFYDVFIENVSFDRKMDYQKLIQIVDDAPIFAKEAKEAGLIDELAYKADLFEKVRGENKKAELFPLKSYALEMQGIAKGMDAIAFMVIEGEIVNGKSSEAPLGIDSSVGSQTVLEQLEEIAKNKDVKALVVRVNSPGGSYSASNEIWYAIKSLKKNKNIPVVVSMGDYAASGGYFVALSGDYILADKSTITGSIGVLGGKFVLKDLWNKIGVNWEAVAFGENAKILSSNHKFSEKEKEVFNRSLDNVYKDFTTKVSEARNISLQDLDGLARGRVWTGDKAVENGLADAIGGIDEAIGKAREMTGIGDEKEFGVIYYPKSKSWAEKVNEMFGRGPMISVQKFIGESKELLMFRRLMQDAAMPPLSVLM